MEVNKEAMWIKELVEVHPVLKGLPRRVKEMLIAVPGEVEDLPMNRRWKRSMKKEGIVLHLYAGPDEGYTLGRAWKQAGGDPKRLLELDKVRHESHDIIENKKLYPALLRAAMSGMVKGVVGGPNCRNRSVLRHYPIPGNPQAPRPVRAWNGDEFGAAHNTEQEQNLVTEGDILMWRMLMIYMVAQYAGRARGRDQLVHLLIEQPASPRNYKSEVVSWWDTREWASLRREFKLSEVTFNQGDLGGMATKPTTAGTSLNLRVEEWEKLHRGGGQLVRDSKELSRWAPEMMNMVSDAIMEEVWGMKPSIRVLSWNEHLAYGHVPFRRDCRVCQESLQQVEPHRRVQHPLGGTLSVDVAGPFVPAYDRGGTRRDGCWWRHSPGGCPRDRKR